MVRREGRAFKLLAFVIQSARHLERRRNLFYLLSRKADFLQVPIVQLFHRMTARTDFRIHLVAALQLRAVIGPKRPIECPWELG